MALLLALAACGRGPSDNQAPVVRIDGPATVAVQPGSPVRLSGSGTDPDGETVTLSWDMGDGTVVEEVPGVEHRYREPGRYLVALSGRDSDDAAATPAEVFVQVGDAAAATDDYALRFDGTGRDDVDRVKVLLDDPNRVRTYRADVGATDMTIEMWLRARPGDNTAGPAKCGEPDAWIYGNVVLDRDRFSQGRKFGMSVADGVVVFGLTGEGAAAASLCGRTRVDDDRWHHVALTRSATTGALRLYVDGRLEADKPDGPAGDVSYPDGAAPRPECRDRPCTRSDPYLVIGAEKHDAGSEFPSFRGLVDELRLSTTIRYPNEFQPPQRRFEPDASTAALYHFDEGGGRVVLDAAGGTADPSHGAVKVGERAPEWVSSGASSAP